MRWRTLVALLALASLVAATSGCATPPASEGYYRRGTGYSESVRWGGPRQEYYTGYYGRPYRY